MRAYRAVRKLHEHARRTALFLLAMATSVGCRTTLLQAGDLTRVSQNGVWEAVDAVPQAKAGEVPKTKRPQRHLLMTHQEELCRGGRVIRSSGESGCESSTLCLAAFDSAP